MLFFCYSSVLYMRSEIEVSVEDIMPKPFLIFRDIFEIEPIIFMNPGICGIL